MKIRMLTCVSAMCEPTGGPGLYPRGLGVQTRRPGVQTMCRDGTGPPPLLLIMYCFFLLLFCLFLSSNPNNDMPEKCWLLVLKCFRSEVRGQRSEGEFLWCALKPDVQSSERELCSQDTLTWAVRYQRYTRYHK